MWMLSFVPDAVLIYVVNIILVVGAISSFITFFAINRLLRWFPALAPYYLLMQIISAVLLVGGIYLRGGYDTEASWREKVHQLELQIAQMEQMSSDLNKQLEAERKKKGKVRVEYYNTVKTEIVEVAKQIDAECKVPQIAIEKLNKAATNPEAKK